MEAWEAKFVGDQEVARHRGRRIFRTENGTYGFEAWMNRKGDGWWCPYTTIEATKSAIDALEAISTPLSAAREKDDELPRPPTGRPLEGL